MAAFSVPDWLIEVSKLAGAIAAIVAALALVSRTAGGKYLKWVFHRVVAEPLRDAAVELIDSTVTPQLDRLEAKNDAQHGENKVALDDNRRSIDNLRLSLVEHREEVNDHLWEVRRTLEKHFGEAARRDQRIEALEQGIQLHGVDVTITATPTVTGEVPAIEAASAEEERS